MELKVGDLLELYKEASKAWGRERDYMLSMMEEAGMADPDYQLKAMGMLQATTGRAQRSVDDAALVQKQTDYIAILQEQLDRVHTATKAVLDFMVERGHVANPGKGDEGEDLELWKNYEWLQRTVIGVMANLEKDRETAVTKSEQSDYVRDFLKLELPDMVKELTDTTREVGQDHSRLVQIQAYLHNEYDIDVHTSWVAEEAIRVIKLEAARAREWESQYHSLEEATSKTLQETRQQRDQYLADHTYSLARAEKAEACLEAIYRCMVDEDWMEDGDKEAGKDWHDYLWFSTTVETNIRGIVQAGKRADHQKQLAETELAKSGPARVWLAGLAHHLSEVYGVECGENLGTVTAIVKTLLADLDKGCKSATARLEKADAELQDVLRTSGWNAALRSVLASLKGYPNAGGDTQIMAEVDRIVRWASQASAIRSGVIRLTTPNCCQRGIGTDGNCHDETCRCYTPGKV